METFKTDLEKQLWEMLYRSQTALAVMCLNEANRNREEENDWPAGQEWGDLSGSSQAAFARAGREKAGIDHDIYLHILRNNADAQSIAEPILEEFCEKVASGHLTCNRLAVALTEISDISGAPSAFNCSSCSAVWEVANNALKK